MNVLELNLYENIAFCSPGCSHDGVCWEEMNICNCTSLFEGDHCEYLKTSLKVLITLIVIVVMIGIIYYFCRKGSSKKRYFLPIFESL